MSSISDNFVGFAIDVAVQSLTTLMVSFFCHSPQKKRKQQGVGAHCSILLKYLHPQQKIDQVIPINGREYEQQLNDCVVVSREIRNIKRKPKVCIVVKHDTFGGNLT